MLRRIAPLLLLLLVAGCDRTQSGNDASSPPAGANGSAVPGTGDDVTTSPTPAGPAIGVPTNACLLLNANDVARLAGGRSAVGKPSTQGPIRSCEYTVSSESGGSASVFLDVADQRTQQLYDVATSGATLTNLSIGALKASYDLNTGKVYALTRKAFVSIQLPLGFGSLTTPEGLQKAAEELALQAVQRIGG